MGCGGGSGESGDAVDEPSALEGAYEECATDDASQEMLSLEDDGATLIVDSARSYNYDIAECVFESLEMSGGLNAKIGRTSAMMGAQEEVENGLEYTWTYHPDNGLDVIITEE